MRQFFGDDFFKRFFGTPAQAQKKTVRSLGSGVIVSPDGHILTNNHVVAGADKLTVILKDKTRYEAKVVGTDPLTDVAVIKIAAENLPAAVLGDSDAVRVGQWVIAVGNPFALMRTVTHGIISATGRSSVGLAAYEDFIQTDAPINPGNSGGALADLDGNVIAINSAISSPSGGNVGLGFAIPINMAKSIMAELLSKGRVIRGFLGLTAQDIDESLVKPLGLKDAEGALVSDVSRTSPADLARIRPGDVIVEFDGKTVESSTDIHNWAAATAPGTRVKIGLLRDGERVDVYATLGERPAAEGAGRARPFGRAEGPDGPKARDQRPDPDAGHRPAAGLWRRQRRRHHRRRPRRPRRRRRAPARRPHQGGQPRRASTRPGTSKRPSPGRRAATRSPSASGEGRKTYSFR